METFEYTAINYEIISDMIFKKIDSTKIENLNITQSTIESFAEEIVDTEITLGDISIGLITINKLHDFITSYYNKEDEIEVAIKEGLDRVINEEKDALEDVYLAVE